MNYNIQGELSGLLEKWKNTLYIHGISADRAHKKATLVAANLLGAFVK